MDSPLSFSKAIPKFFSIDGNIGSGKSTLLDKLVFSLRKNPKVVFLEEPVDEWNTIKDKDGNTMIKKFYEDQTKYSFSFQMMAYISRLAVFKRAVLKNPDAEIFITERSLDTDRFVFAKMLYDQGKMESTDYQIYLKWFNFFALDYFICGVIYIKTTPEICNARVIRRSRNGESSISTEYLTECHEYHEIMINSSINCPCLKINGNIDSYENPEHVEKNIELIMDFIFC